MKNYNDNINCINKNSNVEPSLIWLIWKQIFTRALIYFKNIFHFLTFQTSKLPKTVAKKHKKIDIIFMLFTVSRFPPMYIQYCDIWSYFCPEYGLAFWSVEDGGRGNICQEIIGRGSLWGSGMDGSNNFVDKSVQVCDMAIKRAWRKGKYISRDNW